jgi:hypothetical protein
MSEFIRNDDRAPAGAEDPSELPARVCVPVDLATGDNPEAVVPAVVQLLSTLSRGWEPVQLRFVVSAGGPAKPSAEWRVDAADPETALAVATNLKAMANAVLVDIRLGEPVPVDPAERDTPAPGEDTPVAVADFLASRRARADYVRTISAAWRAVREDSVRWTLGIDIDAMPSPDGADEEVADPAALPEAPTPATMPGGVRLVGARIRLFSHGRSLAAPAITALFGEDTCGPYGLRSRPATGAAAPLTWLPVALAAHLLAAPARMAGAFPAAATEPTDLFGMFEQAATPHILVLGSSGQGKTVLLSRLVHRAFELGEACCVVDVHDGWLAERAIASAKERGLRPVVADFAPPGAEASGRTTGSRSPRGPRIRLTTPPPGIDRRQWADELWDVVRHLLWADMPAEYFGPVGERGVRALIKMAVLDPEDATELADVATLITDPAAAERRRALLERIDDQDLTNVILREVMPMVTSRDPGNSATWLLSKLGPLVESWAVRGARDTLGVERAVKAGRPFVLHAPATVLGDSGSRLVVSIALHRLWLATRRRRTPAPMHVVVDEWQLYPSTTVAAMLSQGRKYGLRMRLANQNLAQLSPVLRDTVLGNSGSVVCFRVGPADAALLDGIFPAVPRHKLQTLPRHTIAVTFGDRDLITAAPPPLPA